MIDGDDVERLVAVIERAIEEQFAELGDVFARRLAAELAPALRPRERRPSPDEPLVGVGVVAAYLGTSEGWVRAHAAQLRARRLGDAYRAPMRFDLVEVDELLLRDGARG